MARNFQQGISGRSIPCVLSINGEIERDNHEKRDDEIFKRVDGSCLFVDDRECYHGPGCESACGGTGGRGS